MKIFRIALALFLVIATGFYLETATEQVRKKATIAGTKDWVHYRSTWGFGIDFPTEPEKKEMQVPVPKKSRTLSHAEFISTTDQDIMYRVSVTKIPSLWQLFGTNYVMEQSLSEMVRLTEGATLLEESTSSFDGINTIDFLMQVGGRLARGRLFMSKGKLFKLSVEYNSDQTDCALYHMFFQSFFLI